MAATRRQSAQHSRSNSAVVPAIPKIFERKIGKALQDPALVSNAHLSRNVNSQEPDQKRAVERSDEMLEKGSQFANGIVTAEGTATTSSSEEHATTPRQVVAAVDVCNSPTSKPRVSLPQHYPPHQSTSLHSERTLPAKAVSGPSKLKRPLEKSSNGGAVMPPRSQHSRSLHRIAFGSFGNPSESSESSPTIPPSATSTHYTQPTPVSDARSQASKSDADQQLAGQPQDKAPKPAAEPGHDVDLVGPYPPGLVGNHVLNFMKYQQQFLAQYLHDLFRRNDGDVALGVRFEKTTIVYNLYSSMLYQSPMLAKALQQSYESRSFTPDGKVHVTIAAQDKFVTVDAVENVLKIMHGIPAFDIKSFDQPYLDPHFFYAQFAASCLLGVPGPQIFGSNCIIDMLNWRTLPTVFDLCLHGKEFSATRDPHPRRSDDIVTPLFQPQITFIFERALAALVQEIQHPEFSFDANAPNFSFIGGLPPDQPAKETPASALASSSVPAARSGIVFGNLNAGGSEKTATLSGLLLSLPLYVLQRVLVDLNAIPGASVIQLAVQERERRRATWASVPGHGDLSIVKEICLLVEYLPNGMGLINDMS